MKQGRAKVERLEVDGLVAPVLRGASEKTLRRRIHVVKADDPSWTPIRYAEGADILRGHARLQALEHVVDEHGRPSSVVCKNCGKVVLVKKAGPIPETCRDGCSRHCDTEGCEKTIAISTARDRAKHGKEGLCLSCSTRKWKAGTTPEARKAISDRGNAALTPEERSARIRTGMLKHSPEERSERSRRAAAARSPEEKARIARIAQRASVPARAAKRRAGEATD